MKSDLHVGFNAPLGELDTPTQTYGCRANNPKICRNYMLDSVCAFSAEDCLCKSPSRAWKKQFAHLQGEKHAV